MTTNSRTVTVSAGSPGLIVYGMDDANKARAAHFKKSQVEVATKAAALMRLNVLTVGSPEQAAVAARIPAGRLYSSGKGFVPHVRRDLYAKVLEVAGQTAVAAPIQAFGVAKSSAGQSMSRAADRKDPVVQSPRVEPPGPVPGYPRNWQDIAVGHLSLPSPPCRRNGGGKRRRCRPRRRPQTPPADPRDPPRNRSPQRHASTVAL